MGKYSQWKKKKILLRFYSEGERDSRNCNVFRTLHKSLIRYQWLLFCSADDKFIFMLLDFEVSSLFPQNKNFTIRTERKKKRSVISVGVKTNFPKFKS